MPAKAIRGLWTASIPGKVCPTLRGSVVLGGAERGSRAPSGALPQHAEDKFLLAERTAVLVVLRSAISAVSRTEMVRPGGVQNQSGQHRAAFRQVASAKV